MTIKIDTERDLVLERTVAVPRALVWAAWTTPEHLVQWFTPAPWKTADCNLDVRAGGEFRTVMHGPNGEVVDNSGCYLEVVDGEKLVFTDALSPGFRPTGGGFMTATILLEDDGEGTKYTAIAQHAHPDARKKHEEMGFLDGWSAALDQLVAVMTSK